MSEITFLETEQQNPSSTHIDIMPINEILYTINREDMKVAKAIEMVIPEMVILVEQAYERLKKGGRLIYTGAGTSGRLGILDASECPPTYGVSYDMVRGIIAGGEKAIFQSVEGAEDNMGAGADDLKMLGLNELDTVIGIAASGRTPYVIGALQYANKIGAYTGSICCVSDGKISKLAKTSLEVITGPEVITGSTRMKAGTAQKMILNMISTTVMIKLGKVYGNLMIDLRPANEKLIHRSVKIIRKCVNCDEEIAGILLEKADMQVKLAVCMGITGLSASECRKLMENSEQNLSMALESVKKKREEI